MTLVVNLFAGPGAGKSTTAAMVFSSLKKEGVNVEMAHEYAKDLTWEKREMALGFQPYVIAKQMWRIQRLIGQVDVVICDSPIIFGLVYDFYKLGPGWKLYVNEVFDSWETLNYLLDRGDRPYQTAGRSQTHAQAMMLDRRIKMVMEDNEIEYRTLLCGKGQEPELVIVNDVLKAI